jgi:hypothetical protein
MANVEVIKQADLAELEELAHQNRFMDLGRFIGVIANWSVTGKTDGQLPAMYARDAASDITDLMAKLPKLLGFDSEIEFVLGYKPLYFGLLSDLDSRDLSAWQGFQGRAFRNAAAVETDDPDELRREWIDLVNQLATFIAKRRRIARARRTGQDRRKQTA